MMMMMLMMLHPGPDLVEDEVQCRSIVGLAEVGREYDLSAVRIQRGATVGAEVGGGGGRVTVQCDRVLSETACHAMQQCDSTSHLSNA